MGPAGVPGAARDREGVAGVSYPSYRNDFQKLVGFRVEALLVSRDRESLYLVVEDGPASGPVRLVFELPVDGECCSHSWWNDVYAPKQLLGGTITAVRHVDMPNADDDPTDDCVQVYGIELVTDRGICTLVFRNASNGYYGGSAYCRLAPPAPPADLEPITEDWSA